MVLPWKARECGGLGVRGMMVVSLGRTLRAGGGCTGGHVEREKMGQTLTVGNASNTVMDVRAALEKIYSVPRRRVQQRREFTV